MLGIGNEFEDGKDDEDFSEDGSPSPSKFEEPSANYTKMLELEHKTEYPGKQVELKSEIKSKS